jgi:kynurenine formamidase
MAGTTPDVDRLYESLKNWRRFGDADERGTLNHLTPERRAAAARLVRDGITVSLARDLGANVQHHMLAAGDARDSNGITGYEAARDHIAADVHGLAVTHVDALSHMFVRGEMYGGRPASQVRSDGARANTVMTMADGVVARGVLLDIPAARGIAHLDETTLVSVEDLEAAERAHGVRVGAGDVLLVSWGREVRERSNRRAGATMSGLHPECLRWLHEREVAVLGSDGISDPMPGLGIPGWPFPVHQVAIVAMGMPLVDNMALAALAQQCAQRSRYEFLFVMSPLRVERATGCPVNPIAVL